MFVKIISKDALQKWSEWSHDLWPMLLQKAKQGCIQERAKAVVQTAVSFCAKPRLNHTIRYLYVGNNYGQLSVN